MNQELLTRLNQIIAKLNAEKQALDQSSKAYLNLAKNVDFLDARLKELSANPGMTGLERSLSNFVAKFESGAKRISVAGKSMRTSIMQATFAKEIPVAAAPVKQVINNADGLNGAGADYSAAEKEQQRMLREYERTQKARRTAEQRIEQEDAAEQRRRLGQSKAREQAEAQQILASNNARLNAIKASQKNAIVTQRELLQNHINELIKLEQEEKAARKRVTGVGEGVMDSYDKEGAAYEKQRQQAKKAAADRSRLTRVGNEAMDVYDKRNADADIKKMRDYFNSVAAAQRELFSEFNKETAKQAKQSPFLGKKLETVPGADRALELAGKIDKNFNAGTLKSVTTEASSQISKLVFSYKTLDGATKNLSVTLDRFGKPLIDTQKRFRSFASNVMRDIQEVAKWSIAVAVVYGPMQKFGELMKDMIDIESQLADVQIALSTNTQSLNSIFSAAYDIAQQTGEGIEGVVGAYNQAYRVTGALTDSTGKMADENERFVVSNKLLSDSIILAKLSTLNQAESIDILSAALKQSGMELTQGTVLLDKWIAVSKVANVDLTTLATGFSVVADTADSVGVSADKLNAVIASVAETSGGGAKEVANAVRGIIGGFQSDKAEAALNKYGIAVKNASGEVRSFIDISEELYQKKESGELGTEAFSELTLAIGGGTRRQAVTSAFISSFSRQSQIEEASANASGDAMDALAIKQDTVQTSLVKLGNAFQQLAQSLGEKGGLLDIFQLIVKAVTGIVEGIGDLTGALGKAGPVLIATLGAVAYLKNQTPAYRENISSQISSAGTNAMLGIYNNSSMLQAYAKKKTNFEGNYTNSALGFGGFLSKNAGSIMAGAGVGVAALGNLSQDNKGAAIADVVGGILGGLATGGNPVGISIGAAAADALYNGVVQDSGSWEEFFNGLFNPPEVSDTPETGGMEDIATVKQRAQQILDEVTRSTALDKVSVWAGGLVSGLTQKETQIALLQNKRESDPEGYKRAMDALQAVADAEKAKKGILVEGNDAEAFANKFADVIKARQEELFGAMAAGDISMSQYRFGKDQIQAFGNVAPGWQGSFLQGRGGTEEGISQLLSFGSKEGVEDLNAYALSITQINTELEKEGLAQDQINKLLEKKNELIREGAAHYDLLIKKIQEEKEKAKEAEIADTPGFQTFDMTPEQFDKAMQSYEPVAAKLEEAGYVRNEEEEIAIYNNGIIKPMTKDWKIVQYLLGQIVKNTDKLTGVYNLPEGASMYVPYEAKLLEPSGMSDQGLSGYQVDLSEKVGKAVEEAITKPVENDKYANIENRPPGEELSATELAELKTLGRSGGMRDKKFEKAATLPSGELTTAPYGVAGAITDAVSGPESSFMQMMMQKVVEIFSGLFPAKQDQFQKPTTTGGGVDMYGMQGGLGESITLGILDLFNRQRSSTPGTRYQDQMNSSHDALMDRREAALNEPRHERLDMPTRRSGSRPDGAGDFTMAPGSLEEAMRRFGTPASLSQPALQPTTNANAETMAPLIASLNSLQSMLSNVKISLNILNTTTLIVDGRQMATVVKKYLKDDLSAFATGTASNNLTVN